MITQSLPSVIISPVMKTDLHSYGIHIVRQTAGWEGCESIKDFDVFIAKDGQTYRYLINNTPFESYIKVVKVDAESGKTIPYAGAGFQIYDPTGNLITMTYNYPTPTVIDTFYTDANGCFVIPEKLGYYFESDMQEFDRKAASDTHILTVYPQPNGDGEVSLLHLKRAATDRFFLFRMTKPGVTLTGEMCLWEDEPPIGTGLPMLFDFLDEVRILK